MREIAEGYPQGLGLVEKIENTVSWAGAAPAGYFTAMPSGESATGRLPVVPMTARICSR